MCKMCESLGSPLARRDFIKTVGVAAAGAAVISNAAKVSASEVAVERKKTPVVIKCAFIYPPTSKLDKAGYYSWPGSSFDAEGRQQQYMAKLRKIEKDLGIKIQMENTHLDTAEDMAAFIKSVKREKPTGLLLIPFKKGHWEFVTTIVEETKVPSVVLSTLGILLMPMVRDLKDKPGVYMISSLDNLDAVAAGLKNIKVNHWMEQSRIVNIDGPEIIERIVPKIGTEVRTIPHKHFYDAFAAKTHDEKVKEMFADYFYSAKSRVEPNREDVLDAAKSYFILKDIIDQNKADALMMNCLPGLQRPHQHVPPCMGYMTLRDAGVAMGCESDLDATLTMMLLQELFDRPGFQHNPSVDTEKNTYFCAHCTAPTKMNGVNSEPEPFILRNHAEAGWGTVPQVLFTPGQEVTIAKYLSVKEQGAKPQMLLYSGEILSCPPNPPAGGCRTNVETTLNEIDDVAELKGHHLTLIYGNYTKELKRFCQLYDIEVVV